MSPFSLKKSSRVPWIGMVLGVLAWMGPVLVYGFQPVDKFWKSKTESLKIEVDAMPGKETVVPGQRFRVFVVATPHKGWHIYSLQTQGEDASLSTRIQLTAKPFRVEGPWKESDPEMRRDEVLEKVLKIHTHRAEFTQVLTVPEDLKPATYTIHGVLSYRVCDNQVCALPRDWPFRFHVIVKSNK